MLQVSRSDVQSEPFPHVVKEGILPPELYKALRADFPKTLEFEEQKSAHGLIGSRTGSGFDIYRGEEPFENLVQSSPAWQEFSEFINSNRFLDLFCNLFSDHFDRLGLQADLSKSEVEPRFVEDRSQLTEKETASDKLNLAVHKALTPFRTTKRPVKLFTRLDIHKSVSGYRKAAHCDRPNRLCSLIIYFTDADKAGLEGGELLVYEHTSKKKTISSYERHPKAEDVRIVAQLKAKENLGVFFPCHNTSYHGVTQVTSTGVERDFLYINISSQDGPLW